jgi:hypothetical protein
MLLFIPNRYITLTTIAFLLDPLSKSEFYLLTLSELLPVTFTLAAGKTNEASHVSISKPPAPVATAEPARNLPAIPCGGRPFFV